MKKKLNAISIKTNVILNLIFGIYAAVCILPLIVIFSVSLSDESSIKLAGYGLIPKNFSTVAYQFIFSDSRVILKAYEVSIIVTLIGSMLSVLIIALFAYPLSRSDFKPRNVFSFILFFTMIFNGGLVPWYLVCTKYLSLKNTIWAMILPYAINAFWVIVMKTFYSTTIPKAIIESARIDGAGETRTFFQIVLPLSKAGLATIALFTTLQFWNDWWLPLNLITKPELYNLQFTIYTMLTNAQALKDIAASMGGLADKAIQHTPTETARMAMCIIAIGPVVFAYPFFQKYFVKGLTIGAVKG